MVLKKKRYDFTFNYMEEAFFPSLLQKWLILHTDPVWYRFIIFGSVVEALVIVYMTPFQVDPFSDVYRLFLKVQLLYNVIYVIDLILAFLQKFVFRYRYPYPNPIRRPFPIMIAESISVIPFDLFLYRGSSYESSTRNIYILVITLHTLKILRFFYHMYNNRRDLNNVVVTRIMEVCIILALFSGYIVHVFYLCQFAKSWYDVYASFQLFACVVGGRGAIVNDVRKPDFNVFKFELLTSFGAIILWCLALIPTLCFVVLSLIESNQHRYDNSMLIHFFKEIVARKYKLTRESYKMLMDYFAANWKLRGGFSKDNFGEFVQNSLRVEIAMDNCWPVFKHSKLFRNAEFYILRALASKITRHIRMEGEYIFSKQKRKPGLIYIAEGVMEVVSNENTESGILCLTSGSCIGEYSLITAHKSPVDFRCKTVCEVFELEPRAFTEFVRSYPREYRQFALNCAESIGIYRRIKEYNMQFNQLNIERLRMIWLKHTLHNMMSFRASYKNTHELSNIYLRQQLNQSVHSQKSVFHTMENLDKLAIRERANADVDLVFIRNTCPWILKASSPITNTWEYIIIITSIYGSLVVTYSFCLEYTDSYKMQLVIVHALFVLDLLMQLITPVSTESSARNLGAVLQERLHTTGFFMDLLSVYYWRMIDYVLDTDLPWYELLKLIKLWRVWRMYKNWSNRFRLNIIFFSIAVGVSIYAALIHLLTCLFLLANITNTLLAPLTIQFATGVGFLFYEERLRQHYSYLFVLANALSVLAEVIVLALFLSALYLHYMVKTRIVSTITSLSKYGRHCDNRWLSVRLRSYFNVLINEKNQYFESSNVARLFELPKYFEIVMKSNMHSHVLEKLEMFQGLSDDLIKNLLLETEIMTVFRHSIILSRGIIYKEVFVVVEGECRTLLHGIYYKTKLMEPLNLLECCYKSPTVTSTVALSEVLVLKFTFETFLRLLHENQTQYKIFVNTVKRGRKRNKIAMLKMLYEPSIVVRSNIQEPSFKRFPYIALRNSFEEYDYHVPFDRIKPFDFVKYFLMRATFYPEGKFIKVYELIRCVFAFISAIAFTIPAANVGAYVNRTGAYELMLALDLFAVLDIYVRMHVCYYTKDGILVTHPLCTAKYYITHGLLVDLVAVFPFDVFPMKVQYRVLLNTIHALQLHRLEALRTYYANASCYYITNTMSAVCYILFGANLVAGFIFVYDCYTWSTSEQVPQTSCVMFNYTTTESHFHILFMVISAIACSGMSGKIKVSELDSMLTFVMCALCIVGVISTTLHKSYIFSCYITKVIEKYYYVVGVRKLNSMMSLRAAGRILRKEVCNYYDLYWIRVGSQNVSELTKNMISALRRDILFRFYGDNLVRYSVFRENSTDITLFVKNLFLVAKPMVIPKGGYVLTINDIEDHLYFLNHGSVDVLAPDGTKLTELTAGAIFGNFSSEQYARQKVSIVANTNTDLIYVSSQDFFNTIEYFPTIYRSYTKLIRMNMYYIESTKPATPPVRMTLQEYITAIKKYATYRIIHNLHLFYVCYLGICVELYQLAVGEMHIIYLGVQYSMDLLHWYHEYLKFRMPYKDEHRAPIFEIQKIVEYRRSFHTEFAVMIVTVIYLDIFLVLPLAFYGHYELDDISYWITLFRLNRLLRAYYIQAAYERQQERVSECSPILVKWFYVMYWFVLSYQLVAAAAALLDTLNAGENSNILRAVSGEMVRNLRRLPPQQKLELYVRYFYFANIVHIDTSDDLYGPMSTLFNIFVILLYLYGMVVDAVLICRFFEAMVDIAVMRRIILTWNTFLRFYMSKSYGTFVVKQRVIDNAKHTWTKTYYNSDFLMRHVCANYLTEVIVDHFYGYLFRRHPVFSHCHIDFVRQLGRHYRLVHYPVNYVIVYKKEDRKCMYFVHKGQVSAYEVDFGYADISLATLYQGESFGFVQGLMPLQRIYEYTYITTRHCEIIELDWDAWNYLLDYFPATKQYIFEMAANVFISQVKTSYLPVEIRQV